MIQHQYQATRCPETDRGRLFRCYITQSGAIVTGVWARQQCSQTTRSVLDPSNRRKSYICVSDGLAFHPSTMHMMLWYRSETPSLATRIRNSASGIRTMHSPGPPAQEIAWRHGTAGCSTKLCFPPCVPNSHAQTWSCYTCSWLHHS